MLLLYLFSLIFACSQLDWPWPPESLGYSGVRYLTLGLTFFWLIWLKITASYLRWYVTHLPLAQLRQWILRYDKIQLLYTFLSFVLLGLELKFGWARAIHTVCTHTSQGEAILFPFAEVLVAGPFLIRLFGGWLFWYDVERQLYLRTPIHTRKFWSRLGFLLYQLRHFFLLVFVPILVMVFIQSLERHFPQSLDENATTQLGLVCVSILFLFLPLLLPMILGLQPMTASALRDRFEDLSRRMHFRFRELYLMDTRDLMANAFIVGVMARTRILMFSDRLVSSLSREELEAVFGHEMGHAKQAHYAYRSLFVILSCLLLSQCLQLWHPQLDPYLPTSDTFRMLIAIGCMGIYLFFGLGFLNRRFERQADLIGCQVASISLDPKVPIPSMRQIGPGMTQGIDALIAALMKTDLSSSWGVRRSKNHWLDRLLYPFRWIWFWLHHFQHGSMQSRIAFLHAIRLESGLAERTHRRINHLQRWSIAIIAAMNVLLYLQ